MRRVAGRLMVVALVVLLAACAKPAGPKGDARGEEAKASWDSARTAEQLQHLRERALLTQTDR